MSVHKYKLFFENNLGAVLIMLLFLTVQTNGQDKLLWRFSILASIDEIFVEQFGGLENCDALIRFQLDSINNIYYAPGVFDGLIEFYLDSLKTFTPSGLSQANLPHPDQNNHIVYEYASRIMFNWLNPPINAVLFMTPNSDIAPFLFFTPGHWPLKKWLPTSGENFKLICANRLSLQSLEQAD